MSPTFAELGVPTHLVERLGDLGLAAAFPIQEAALPDALAGRDVIGQAATGSGKTLAYGLALLARLDRARPLHPRALVLAPTRELASQVQRTLASLHSDPRRVISIYGGTPYGATRRALAAGVDVVVACPGRLEDLLERQTLHLDQVALVVVDEADRMADMGFLPAVERIIAQTAPVHQTLLFSATLDPAVRRLVTRFTRDAVVHDVVDSSAPSDVDHHFWRVGRDQRVAVVAETLATHRRAIVFTRTKHGADRLAKQLADRGISTAALHGGRSQAQRDRAVSLLASGRIDALVATDVAARGLHIESLPAVIHYDLPAQTDDYVHRSGRTGRAGARGTVISLVTDETVGAAHRLQRALGLPSAITEPVQLPSDERPPAPTPPSAGNQPARAATPPEHRTRAERPASHAAVAPTSGGYGPRSRPQDRHPQDRRPRQGEAVVTYFNESRGYGFARDERGDDLFIHHTRIDGEGFRTLTKGERISFDEVRGPKGREAHNVQRGTRTREASSRGPAHRTPRPSAPRRARQA